MKSSGNLCLKKNLKYSPRRVSLARLWPHGHAAHEAILKVSADVQAVEGPQEVSHCLGLSLEASFKTWPSEGQVLKDASSENHQTMRPREVR